MGRDYALGIGYFALLFVLLFLSQCCNASGDELPPKSYVIFVHSDECAPCRRMMSDVRLAQGRGVVVRHVNISTRPELGKRLKVNVVPTLLLVRNNRIVARREGYAKSTEIHSFFHQR